MKFEIKDGQRNIKECNDFNFNLDFGEEYLKGVSWIGNWKEYYDNNFLKYEGE